MTQIDEAQALQFLSSLSNWGRWGEDDELGTLNLITSDKRRRSGELIRHGIAVSCALDLDVVAQRDDLYGPPYRLMLRTGEGLASTPRQASVAEYVGIVAHGHSVTHLDALSHMFWDRKMYNGEPAHAVTAGGGACKHAVTSARQGIVTRGVLVDVPRHRDVRWLEAGESVEASEVAQILVACGIEPESGDAVLLRTGYGRKRVEVGPDRFDEGRPGWGVSCLPWFHDAGIALIGSDTAQEVIPSRYAQMPLPIHAVGITAMGLWLLDNCDLETLSVVCAEHATWEFQFVVAPLPLAGATGSPVNPLAVL